MASAGPAAAQDTSTEHAGDWVMWALPVTAATSTILLGDEVGSRDFAYGATFNVAVTEGLKRLLPKERPDGSDTKSFPSGHTSISFQSASFIHFRYGARYAWPAYVAATFVGYSRVQGRAHFIEDVVGGMVIGVASSLIFTERRPEDPGPDPQVGAGLRLSFGGGLSSQLSFGLVTIGR